MEKVKITIEISRTEVEKYVNLAVCEFDFKQEDAKNILNAIPEEVKVDLDSKLPLPDINKLNEVYSLIILAQVATDLKIRI